MNNITEDDASYYRGVSIKEAKQWAMGKPIPTRPANLMPLDWEVVEYGLEDAKSMSEEEIEQHVKSVCWWYDGSTEAIEGGLNMTNDFDNATGYGDAVLGFS